MSTMCIIQKEETVEPGVGTGRNRSEAKMETRISVVLELIRHAIRDDHSAALGRRLHELAAKPHSSVDTVDTEPTNPQQEKDHATLHERTTQLD